MTSVYSLQAESPNISAQTQNPFVHKYVVKTLNSVSGKTRLIIKCQTQTRGSSAPVCVCVCTHIEELYLMLCFAISSQLILKLLFGHINMEASLWAYQHGISPQIPQYKWVGVLIIKYHMFIWKIQCIQTKLKVTIKSRSKIVKILLCFSMVVFCACKANVFSLSKFLLV